MMDPNLFDILDGLDAITTIADNSFHRLKEFQGEPSLPSACYHLLVVSPLVMLAVYAEEFSERWRQLGPRQRLSCLERFRFREDLGTLVDTVIQHLDGLEAKVAFLIDMRPSFMGALEMWEVAFDEFLGGLHLMVPGLIKDIDLGASSVKARFEQLRTATTGVA